MVGSLGSVHSRHRWTQSPGPGRLPSAPPDGPADRGRERPRRGPDVQHLRGAAKDGGHDPGVAGQHPCLACADRAAMCQGGRTHPVAQVLQVHGDGDVRAFPALQGASPRSRYRRSISFNVWPRRTAGVLASGVPPAAGCGAARPSIAWASSSTPRSSNFPFKFVSPVLALRAPMVNSTFSAGVWSSRLPSGSQVRATIWAKVATPGPKCSLNNDCSTPSVTDKPQQLTRSASTPGLRANAAARTNAFRVTAHAGSPHQRTRSAPMATPSHFILRRWPRLRRDHVNPRVSSS
jgi:hypothetical protein